MISYNVIVEPIANDDLLDIVSYITRVLQEPDTASRLYTDIKNKIASLGEMPKRCKVVNDEPYKSMELRKMQARSYSVFYLVDDSKNNVHIIRVLYNRREWKELL